MKNILRLLLWCIPLSGATAIGASAGAGWKAGAAAVDLTPQDSVWMGGYAGRNHGSQGVALKIFAKALAIEDSAGARFVIVTLDLVSVPRYLRETLAQRVKAEYGLPSEALLLNASHTHAGPELRLAKERTPYAMPPAMWNRLLAYRAEVEEKIFAVIGQALAARAPATLSFVRARAGFAMNRRLPMPGGVFANRPHADGPVDHEVPVLHVTGADGKTKALLFGYACHNTTVGSYQLSGDYAGHAQYYLQKDYPGATALFLQGCGGDQNPYPRQTMVAGYKDEDLANQHGRTLATAVSAALATRPKPLSGPLRSALSHVDLPYRYLTPAELDAALRGSNSELKARAQAQVKKQELGPLPKAYPNPVQALRIGDDFVLVAIGQEVVVDYSLRLKRELQGVGAVWVAGYSNDVAGYLGSRRVLQEGGYEGGGANLLVGHPAPYAFSAEDDVIAAAHRLLASLKR